MRESFARLDVKHKVLEILRKIFENFQKILKKIAEIHYFSIFFKKLDKPIVNFHPPLIVKRTSLNER